MSRKLLQLGNSCIEKVPTRACKNARVNKPNHRDYAVDKLSANVYLKYLYAAG